MTGVRRRVAVCADVGSTFTKVAAVDLGSGALLGTAVHPTTIASDVLDGLDAAVAQLTAKLPPGSDIVTTDVCSSAGGGLRLAVVGYERLVTAEAGRRVALSAGARVVAVAAGRLDRAGLAELRSSRPDVVLLVGGTDGGDAEVLRHNAATLAAARLAGGRARVPVVVAGNVDARDDVVCVLSAAGTPVVATANVLPRIGRIDPGPARAAIREVFLRHVIGGKRLSRGRRFASLVRGPTPDIVLTAVELLADHVEGDLVVIDVGGATTDVYSVIAPDASDEAAQHADVAGTMWRLRTVEGDLGMRWSATGVVEAAAAERLLRDGEQEALSEAARVRSATPAWIPQTDSDREVDDRLAALAATIALRRHARPDGGRKGQGELGSGKDLSRVRVLIGSGGVLRYAPPGSASAILGTVLADRQGGWALPRRAHVVLDAEYVLAPAGLLAAEHPGTALALMMRAFGESGLLAKSAADARS